MTSAPSSHHGKPPLPSCSFHPKTNRNPSRRTPPNVRFEIDDVESGWTYPFKFDYIFCRYMSCSIGDWPRLVSRVHEHLEPGAWAEFQDLDFVYRADDGSFTEQHAFKTWNRTLVEGLNKINRDPSPAPKLLGWVKDAGFVNVREEIFKIPVGRWARDMKYK